MTNEHGVLNVRSSAMPGMIREVDVTSIHVNRHQPRTHFDAQALDELAASIREHGLIQPLIVTAHAHDRYELIAGERRWRAACQAGLRSVPVLVKDATPQQLLELALVENVQRADLNPLEEGRAYQTLKDEFGLKDEDVAQRVGKSRVAIANARRLIRLSPVAQQALIDGTISAGHGRALLRLEDADEQAQALALVVQHDLSVRDIERIADLALNRRIIASTRQALLTGTISIAHAQALLLLDGTEQEVMLKAVIQHQFGTRITEQLCRQVAHGLTVERALEPITGQRADVVGNPPSPRALHDPERHNHDKSASTQPSSAEDTEVQRLFEEILGTPVQIIRHAQTIRLVITMYNDEQVQGLYDLLASTV